MTYLADGAIDRTGLTATSVSADAISNTAFTRKVGDKNYELSNHLGNVMVVVTDKKIGVSGSSPASDAEYYLADVVSSQDYYSFGAPMPGRGVVGSTPYRYGFNGKEKDSEMKGDGNTYNYGMRLYDARLGRPFSSDPLESKYPQLSPYQFFSDSPVRYVDLDGLEASLNPVTYMFGDAGISQSTGDEIAKQTVETIGAIAKYSGPPLLIIGGTISVIATAGGSAPALLSAFTVTSGTFAVATGTAQIVMQSTGNGDKASQLPTSYSDASVGLIIQGTVGDSKFTAMARGVLTMTEGIITLDVSNLRFPENAIDAADKSMAISNIFITGATTWNTIYPPQQPKTETYAPYNPDYSLTPPDALNVVPNSGFLGTQPLPPAADLPVLPTQAPPTTPQQ